MHCGATANEEALPFIITELPAQGYSLQTVANILSPDPLALVQE